MLLVSGSTKTVRGLSEQWPERLGHLLTPSNRNGMKSILATGLWWAADNGAYNGFEAKRFRWFLRKISGAARLLWIACPDAVADARATLAMFEEWRPEVASVGPVAFVGQDGSEALPVPWDRMDCFFLGGSTRWKLSEAAAGLAQEAKRRGKLVHMGRVNSRRRMETAHNMGCDSIDGSSASMFGDKYIYKYCLWMRQIEAQGGLYQ